MRVWVMLGALLFPAVALADTVLVEKLPDSNQSRLTSDLGGGGQRAADDFVLATGGTVTGVDWYGTFLLSSTFRIEIYSDAGGVPATTPLFQTFVATTGTDTGQDGTNGQDIIKFSAAIVGPALLAGPRYWISVADSLTDNDLPGQQPWDWQASAFVSGAIAGAYRLDDSSAWQLDAAFPEQRNELAFALRGTIPEPSTLLLVIAGAAWFVLHRRR